MDSPNEDEESLLRVAFEGKRLLIKDPLSRKFGRSETNRSEVDNGFSKIYREGTDDRTAVIRDIIAAIGPGQNLGSLGEDDMARKSMRLHSRRTEENDLMRTAVLELGERSCGRDDECVLRQAFGKSAVEYLNAQESLVRTETGDLPSRRKACLSCVRDDVVWHWMFLHHRGEARNGYISGHYNAVEVIGEYRIDQCLHDPSYGLPLPVVASNLGYLRPEEGFTLEGHRTTYFRQEGYLKIESARDFSVREKDEGEGDDEEIPSPLFSLSSGSAADVSGFATSSADVPEESSVRPWRPIRSGEEYLELESFLANRWNVAERERDPDRRRAVLEDMDRALPLAVAFERTAIDPKILVESLPLDRLERPSIAMHVYRAKKGFSHPVDDFMSVVIRKAECAPCRSRGLSEVIASRIRELRPLEARQILDGLFRIILSSLLGSYSTAKVQLDFGARFRLWEWYTFSGYDVDGFVEWIGSNSMLFTCCVREAVFHETRLMPAYQRHQSRYMWFQLREKLSQTMDSCRKIFNARCAQIPSASLSNRDVRMRFDEPRDMKTLLVDYNDESLKISPRFMTESFPERAAKAFKTIAKKNNNNPYEPSEEEIDACGLVRDLVEAHEASAESDGTFPYEYLHRFFGVSFESVVDLREGEMQYSSAIIRTKVQSAVSVIFDRSRRDFLVLRTYFEALQMARGLVYGRLPYSVAAKQIEALRATHGLDPDDELPPVAGTFFVCPRCTAFKAQIVGDQSRCGKVVRMPVYDLITRDVHCSRLVGRQNDGKKNECGRQKLRRVNMIGRRVWTRMQKACVYLCPKCLNLAILDERSPVGDGLECGCSSARAKQKQKPPCMHCGSKNTKPVLAVDDEGDHPMIRSFPFCSKHCPRSFDEFERLSEIKKRNEEISRVDRELRVKRRFAKRL